MSDTMQEATLRCLVIRARRGDTRAFDQLVRRYQDQAVGYARHVLFPRGDRAAAEDAAQEAFVQAWRELPALADPVAFPAWLRRIVFKFCDRAVRRIHGTSLSLDDAPEVAGGTDPAAMVEQSADAARLRQALHALPLRERECALLYYRDEGSVAEIARFLNVPQSTVKNRLHTARKRLRKELWDMAEEILAKEKPSGSSAFADDVLRRILETYQAQVRADPHTAERGLLTQGRSQLDGALETGLPLDWSIVRHGLTLLLEQADRKALATLMERYLAQDLDNSRRVWALMLLSNNLACIGEAAGAVGAHETLERILPRAAARLSPEWPHDPVPPHSDEPALTEPNDLLLLALSKSGEFADAWYAIGRGGDYLARIDRALAASSRTELNRTWRFFCLRMGCTRAALHGNKERAASYVEQMYSLAEEPDDRDKAAHFHVKAQGHDMDLRQDAGDLTGFEALCQERTRLLETATGRWVRGERHNFAYTLYFAGRPAQALALFEQNVANGGHANGWAYVFHAAADYHLTGDRIRALTLLREGAVRVPEDIEEVFVARPEFARVRQDPEFLAAVRRPG